MSLPARTTTALGDRAATADASNRVRSLRDGSTREDELEGVGSNVAAYKRPFTSRAKSKCSAVSPDPTSPVEQGSGTRFSSATAAHSSCVSLIEGTSHSTTDANPNALGREMFTAKSAERFCHSVNADEAIDDVTNVIRANFARERSDKVAAFKTGYTQRGANAIKNGDGKAISFAGMWRAAAAYPEVAKAIETWARKMQEPDFFEPETQRQFHQFLRAVDGRIGKPRGSG